jgi:hypothetical protein
MTGRRAVTVMMATIAAIAFGVVNATPTLAAYSGACHSISQIFDYQNAVPRGAALGGTGTDLDGVYGEAVLRTVTPCSSPPSGIQILTAILPANLQNSSNGGIVQPWNRPLPHLDRVTVWRLELPDPR